MTQESIVYGCIKDVLLPYSPDQSLYHRQKNRDVLMSLPSIEEWPLLSREMFSMPIQVSHLVDIHTDVMHFGASYKSVEYEWQHWINQFETMLKNMYWVSATVHLETEFNGRHTFCWEAQDSFHEPDSHDLPVRCEWSRESAYF